MNLEMVSIILAIVGFIFLGLGAWLRVNLNEVIWKIVGQLLMSVGLISMFGFMSIAFYMLLGAGDDIVGCIAIVSCILFGLFMIVVAIAVLCCDEEKEDNSYREFKSEHCCEEKCSGIHISGGDSENASDSENDELMELYRKGKISKCELIELLK